MRDTKLLPEHERDKIRNCALKAIWKVRPEEVMKPLFNGDCDHDALVAHYVIEVMRRDLEQWIQVFDYFEREGLCID